MIPSANWEENKPRSIMKRGLTYRSLSLSNRRSEEWNNEWDCTHPLRESCCYWPKHCRLATCDRGKRGLSKRTPPSTSTRVTKQSGREIPEQNSIDRSCRRSKSYGLASCRSPLARPSANDSRKYLDGFGLLWIEWRIQVISAIFASMVINQPLTAVLLINKYVEHGVAQSTLPVSTINVVLWAGDPIYTRA